MSSAKIHVPKPGFNFDLHQRNVHLAQKGMNVKATSTGTTIVGVIFDGGVVLGADTRATSGPIVADKNCEKIHYLTPNIWCAGAGTAADTEWTTQLISSQLELHSLSTNRKPRLITALTLLKQYLFRHQGQIGAYLVVGGVSFDGPSLYTVHAHGSTDKLPFVAMGSGSLAAMAVLESSWKKSLTRQEAMDLVTRAISAGIFNDLGSGSNVDLCVIDAEKAQVHRGYSKPNERGRKEQRYVFEKGTTAVLREEVRKFVVDEVSYGYKSASEVETTGQSAGDSAMEVDA